MAGMRKIITYTNSLLQQKQQQELNLPSTRHKHSQHTHKTLIHDSNQFVLFGFISNSPVFLAYLLLFQMTSLLLTCNTIMSLQCTVTVN